MLFPGILDDIPSSSLLAYPLETVVAEKFQCIVDLADENTRMKDYFDIYKILTNHTIDENNLAESIQRTFRNRNTIVGQDSMLYDAEFGNRENMKRLWKIFLKKIKYADNLEFSDVWNYIKERLARYVV